MANLITQHMDIWSTAEMPKTNGGRGRGKNSNGQSSYGIKKLRELILELAVRGKLVPQDPNDEPASVLLDKIAKEKARLIKEGKIKKQKPLPEIGEDEEPFELPTGWEWARIGQIGHDWGQKKPEKDFTYIEVSGIDNVAGIVRSPKRLTAAKAPSRARKIVKFGTVIYSTVRPYLQNICVIDQEYSPEPIASTAFAILHPFQQMPGEFFTSYLRSPIFVNYVESVQTGIAYPAINDKQFLGGLVPIPPCAEQNRIVAKVDELMGLCDQLEQQQTDSNATHQTLLETLLSTLTDAADQRGFAKAWQRMANHFDTLFTTEQSIDHLKQTILQLAVMGKLVPQDSNNEPASVLLGKIAKEKARLIKKGKKKKQKPLPEITEEETPFELPVGWKWVRFGDIGEILGGGTPRKSTSAFWNGEIPWISPKDMKFDYISDSIDKITIEALEKSSVKLIPNESLLIVVRGMILSHSFPAAINMVPVTINQDMKAVVLYGHEKSFVLLMIKGLKNDFVGMVERSTHGTCKLVSDKLWKKVLAIPPLVEQRRIVAKVDELMTLCDTLKSRLNNAQTTQVQLADAIVEKAVANKSLGLRETGGIP